MLSSSWCELSRRCEALWPDLGKASRGAERGRTKLLRPRKAKRRSCAARLHHVMHVMVESGWGDDDRLITIWWPWWMVDTMVWCLVMVDDGWWKGMMVDGAYMISGSKDHWWWMMFGEQNVIVNNEWLSIKLSTRISGKSSDYPLSLTILDHHQLVD